VKTQLDRIDTEIIRELQINARLSNKELAARVGLAPSSCLERVRKLQLSGVLRGYHAEVDATALGVELGAMISIKLRRHSRDLVEGFQRYILSLPEVAAVCYLAGPTDFVIQVGVHDTDQLRDLILERISTREEVEHIETAIIFEHAQRWVLPDYTTGADKVD
jgi:DNA-binding Lrp family transcriptional regulator